MGFCFNNSNNKNPNFMGQVAKNLMEKKHHPLILKFCSMFFMMTLKTILIHIKKFGECINC